MSLAENVCSRLTSLGIRASIDDGALTIEINSESRTIRIDAEWEDAYSSYKRARSSSFDSLDLTFTLNRTIEFPLVRLDLEGGRDPLEYFTDSRGNSVLISRASQTYSLAHFDSTAYEKYFQSFVKPRLERSRLARHTISILLRAPITAIYSATGRKIPTDIKKLAIERIQSCLVKMAIERHFCFEFWTPRTGKSVAHLGESVDLDTDIPSVSYERDVVNYYLVARSSPFSSQSFLAYYHVLEYYFLKVSEDALHHQLSALINKTSFKSNTDGLDKVISLVRKQARQDDETEMLRKVLQRFVDENDFIQYVQDIESEHGEKIYSKRRTIFGEHLGINLTEGHALSNAGNLIKHVRNAIVHSSDRYNREECHIPLSPTEETIEEFIPLVRYFAEKIIFGTAAQYRYS